MIEVIYAAIEARPDYFAWAFGLVNILWGVFLHFNKKRHERELVSLKGSIEHQYNLELEKRRRLYEMKATQFEKYFRMVDDFGKKHQVDMPRRMQPIINEYFTSYLDAQQRGDEEASRAAIISFSGKINLLLAEGNEDYMTIQAETHSLKLIATEQLAEIFEQLEAKYAEGFKLSQDLMNEIVVLIARGDDNRLQEYQKDLQEQGAATKAMAEALMRQMRIELHEI